MPQDDKVRHSYADTFNHLAAHFDRAGDKSVKPKHLYVDMRRAAIRAGRLAFEVAKARAIPNHVKMCDHWVEVAQVMFKAMPTGDSAWGFWKFAVLPGIKAVARPGKLTDDAGAFDFPPPKTDAKGHLLGKDGERARVRYFKRDGQEVDQATWEAAAPGDRGKAKREVASVVDDYDEADMLAHGRTQAGDYADACRALAALLREEDGEGRAPCSAERPGQPAWHEAGLLDNVEPPRSWELTATVRLNQDGHIKSWVVKSPSWPEAMKLTRTEGGCLAILAAAAKKKGRPYVPLRGFSNPFATYREHKCGNPQRSLRSLCQKLCRISRSIVEHAGPQGYRIMPDIGVRLSVSRKGRQPYVKTCSLTRNRS